MLRAGAGLSTERDSARAAAEAASFALRSADLERADLVLVFATTPHGPGFTCVTRTAGEVCGTAQVAASAAARAESRSVDNPAPARSTHPCREMAP